MSIHSAILDAINRGFYPGGSHCVQDRRRRRPAIRPWMSTPHRCLLLALDPDPWPRPASARLTLRPGRYRKSLHAWAFRSLVSGTLTAEGPPRRGRGCVPFGVYRRVRKVVVSNRGTAGERKSAGRGGPRPARFMATFERTSGRRRGGSE